LGCRAMEASMKRFALSAAALAFTLVVAAGSAQADRGMHGGGGFHDRGFRHHFFFHHGFFRPFFFFGVPVFAPVPIALYPQSPYPSYLYAPMESYPGCYEYQTTIVINGQLAPAWGMACLQPDGTWRMVN
jgi:hypothetical protein